MAIQYMRRFLDGLLFGGIQFNVASGLAGGAAVTEPSSALHPRSKGLMCRILLEQAYRTCHCRQSRGISLVS
jgi:hypothetical protein